MKQGSAAQFASIIAAARQLGNDIDAIAPLLPCLLYRWVRYTCTPMQISSLRYLAIIALGLLFTATLTAQERGSNDSVTNDPVTLKVWNIPSISSNNPVNMAKARVYHAFRQAHPEIRLEALSKLRIEGGAGEGNEYLAIAGGRAPDVYYLYGRKLGDYVNQKFIMPLEPLIADDPAYQDKEFAGIWVPHNIWEAAILPDADGDEHLWGVPIMHYVMALFYRNDIFLSRGITRPPQDWDELYFWSRAVTRDPMREPDAKPDEPRIFGFTVSPPMRGGGWKFLQYVWGAGGQILQPYATAKGSDKLVPWTRDPVPFDSFRIAISDTDRYQQKLQQQQALRESVLASGVEIDTSVPLQWRLVIDKDGVGRTAINFLKRLMFSNWMRCLNRDDKRHFDYEAGRFLEFDLSETDLRGRAEVACPVCGTVYDLSIDEVHNRVYQGVVASFDTQEQARDITAMWIGTFEEMPTIYNLSAVRLAPFPPAIRGEVAASFTAGHYLSLNEALRDDPKRLAAAWKFINFLTSDDALRIRTETFVDQGLGSWMRPDLLQRFGYRDALERQQPELRDAMAKATENTEVEPYAKGFYHIMVREFGVMLDKALKPGSDVDSIIEETVMRCNSRILGKPPKAEIRKKKQIGLALIVIATVLIIASAGKIVRILLRGQQVEDTEGFGVRDRGFRRSCRIGLFLLPAVALILLWSYYPLARGTTMAFQEVKLLEGSRWIGLENFVQVLGKAEFYRYLLQTAYYVVLSLVLGFFAPVILAILLTEIPRGKIFFRTVYYLPAVTTGLVVLFLWKQLIYDPSGAGLLNQVAGFFGMPTTNWLQDPVWAMVCVVFPTIWAGVGAGCLIYLAALKGVPDEQYEAADLDGAGPWHKLIHVVMPNLYALLIINLIGAVVGAFHASQNIFVMTAGGPEDKTMTVGLDIWYNSFLYLDFGYATAEAWVLGALLIGFTLGQLRILNKLEFKKAPG